MTDVLICCVVENTFCAPLFWKTKQAATVKYWYQALYSSSKQILSSQGNFNRKIQIRTCFQGLGNVKVKCSHSFNAYSNT